MSYITVGDGKLRDVQIHYNERGSGEPVVFIHGWWFQC